MKHILPELTYAYDALEPWIDAETMHIHHDKHHQAYVDKINAALDGLPTLKDSELEKIITNLSTLDIDPKAKILVRNHGGGHLNHSFFWTNMAPEKAVDEALVADITSKWGSLDTFKTEFTASSMGHFGSGWTWLVRDGEQALQLYSLPNQDSPLSIGHTPVVALDLWEHAYYLKYKNVRAEYIAAWWKVVKNLP